MELIGAIEGVLFRTAPGNNWHHIACWSDDLGAERHVYPVYELAGTVIALARQVEVRVNAERTTP